jgi:hypothetical protein
MSTDRRDLAPLTSDRERNAEENERAFRELLKAVKRSLRGLAVEPLARTRLTDELRALQETVSDETPIQFVDACGVLLGKVTQLERDYVRNTIAHVEFAKEKTELARIHKELRELQMDIDNSNGNAPDTECDPLKAWENLSLGWSDSICAEALIAQGMYGRASRFTVRAHRLFEQAMDGLSENLFTLVARGSSLEEYLHKLVYDPSVFAVRHRLQSIQGRLEDRLDGVLEE